MAKEKKIIIKNLVGTRTESFVAVMVIVGFISAPVFSSYNTSPPHAPFELRKTPQTPFLPLPPTTAAVQSKVVNASVTFYRDNTRCVPRPLQRRFVLAKGGRFDSKNKNRRSKRVMFY